MKTRIFFSTLLSILFTTVYAGVVPGTIQKQTAISPERSCQTTSVGSTNWPVYACQQSVSAGCKLYTPTTPSCTGGNTSNTFSPSGDCSNASSSTCSGTCTNISTKTCTNDTPEPGNCPYGYTHSYFEYSGSQKIRVCRSYLTPTMGQYNTLTVPFAAGTMQTCYLSGFDYDTASVNGYPLEFFCSNPKGYCTFPCVKNDANTRDYVYFTLTKGGTTSVYSGYSECSSPTNCRYYGSYYNSTTYGEIRVYGGTTTTACSNNLYCDAGYSKTNQTYNTSAGANNSITCSRSQTISTAKTCNTYYTVPVLQNYITLTKYSNNLGQTYSFGQSSFQTKIVSENANSCQLNAYATDNSSVTTNSLGYTPPTSSITNCEKNNTTTWNGGQNGSCRYTSTNYVISSYNQTQGKLTFSTPTTGYSTNINTCSVDGLITTLDSSAPTASINGVGNVFGEDDTKWCNIKRYRGEGYTYKSDENPGCEFYKSKNTNISGQEDLLKGLEITVPGDPSGIGEVQVRVGTCSYTYTSDSTLLGNILVSTTSPSGVKSTYKDGFVIRYSTAVTALGKSQPGLLSAFGKTRLDECLEEGKNSIAILIKDMAVSESDGITASPNTGAKFSKGTINIDNSTAKLKLFGDLTSTYLSGGTVIGGVTSEDVWRNYTIGGNMQGGEIYKGGEENKCKSFSGGLTGQCSGGLSGGQIWTAPSGVDPVSGKFMQYKCDNLGPFPDASECQKGCPNGQTWNPNTNTCGITTNVCKAYVGGAEVVIENGVNGVVSGSTCMAYCIPGHSVGCVIKPTTPSACSISNAWDIITIFNNLYGRDPQCSGYEYYKNLFDTNPTAYSNIACRYKAIESGTDALIMGDCAYYKNKFGHDAPSLSCGGSTYSNYSSACSGGPTIVNGSCGSSNGTTVGTVPTSNLCTSGTASSVTGSGPWSWTCNGSGGGGSVNCFANKSGTPVVVVNGSCGSSNGTTVGTVPTSNLCTSGTASSVTGSGPWSWMCYGSGGGSDSSCFASKTVAPVVVNGSCGASNGITVGTPPTSGLCASGSPSGVSGSGPWSWMCYGSGGGSNSSCSANKTTCSVILMDCGGNIVSGSPSSTPWCDTYIVPGGGTATRVPNTTCQYIFDDSTFTTNYVCTPPHWKIEGGACVGG